MRFRYICAMAALAIAAAAPAARAQGEPPHTKELKEAEKFIASAMTTADTTEKRARYERALNPLQQAIAQNPENARVWLAAGEVYAALHDYARADSALAKAETLYPKFHDDVVSERISAWADAFLAGVNLMDAKKDDEALAMFRTAERMYDGRPEAKLNIGALLANKGESDKAIEAFQSAIAVIEGPLIAKLKPEDAAQWKRYGVLAHMNIAQLHGQTGVQAFSDQDFDKSIDAFQQAMKFNPVARDYSFNLAQSYYAKVSRMEEVRNRLVNEQEAAQLKKNVALAKIKGDSLAELNPKILAIYDAMDPMVAKAREVDPNNEDLFLLQARSHRIRSELAKDVPTRNGYSKQLDDLLKLHDENAIEILGINVATNAEGATISGKLKNRKLPANTPVKIHFTLLGVDAAPVGEQEITVNAPTGDTAAPFEATIKATTDIAGWKYTVIK